MRGVGNKFVSDMREYSDPTSHAVTGADGKQCPARRFDALHGDLVSMSNAVEGDFGIGEYQYLGMD
jgi:hypothetical protein